MRSFLSGPLLVFLVAGLLLAGPAAARQGDAPAAARGSVGSWPVREGFAGLEAALGELADQHPGMIDLIEIGESAAGRALIVGVLGPRREVEQLRRPGILVCPDLDGEPGAGAKGALELCERLLRKREGGELHPVLARATLYVLFAPRPDDLAEPTASARSVNLEDNFPVGWVPWVVEGRRPGPYPLSTPESQAIARFALERESLALSVVLGGEGLALPAFVELGAGHEDLATLEALLASAPRVAAARNGRLAQAPRPGGFAEFCFARCGIFPLSTDAPGSGLSATSVGDQEMLDVLEVFFADLAARLPSLDTSDPRLERLGPSLWLLELEVQNTGRMPSASELGVLQRVCGPVVLELAGGDVLGAAVRDHPSGDFEVVESDGNRVPMGQLGGAEARSVRLVVRADPEASLSIELGAPRSGRVQLPVTLP